MAGFSFTFDPTSESAANTALELTPANGYWLLADPAPSFATPDLEPLWASSVDTEGERLASSRYKNRTITFTVRCREDSGLSTPEIGDIVQTLQSKVAKLTREQGTLKVEFPSTDTIVFDVLTATVQVPVGQSYATTKRTDVAVTLTCKPFGRGEEVTLDDHSETSLPVLVFTETGIKGDVPGTAVLPVDLDSSQADNVLWGLQSHYYDDADSAALFFEAEDCIAVNAALAVGTAGASGDGTNKVLRHQNIGISFTAGFDIGLGSDTTYPTHLGIYRVFVRVFPLATNTGIASLQLQWRPYRTGDIISNPAVALVDDDGAAIAPNWSWVDLGMVQIPTGSAHTSQMTVYDKSTVATDDLDYDCVCLIPANEGSGRVTQATMFSGDSVKLASDSVLVVDDPLGPYEPSNYQGDFLSIPPAGSEERVLRVIVLATSVASNDGKVLLQETIPDVSAQLTYTPRYLIVPEPS